MSLLDALERRLGRFAIHNLTIALVVGWVVAFLMAIVQPKILGQMVMDPVAVANGEIWRLFSFLLVPPVLKPIWFLFTAYIFWIFGSALEAQWGHFRYNAYILVGWLMAVVVALLHLVLPFDFSSSAMLTANLFIVISVKLAFAALFPNYVLHLFFILPVKVKWLALVLWIILAGLFVMGSWSQRLLILAALANFFLFFTPAILRRLRSRQRALGSQVKQFKESRTPFHTCHVCGATDLQDPERVFRVDTAEGGSQDICVPCLDQRKSAQDPSRIPSN